MTRSPLLVPRLATPFDHLQLPPCACAPYSYVRDREREREREREAHERASKCKEHLGGNLALDAALKTGEEGALYGGQRVQRRLLLQLMRVIFAIIPRALPYRVCRRHVGELPPLFFLDLCSPSLFYLMQTQPIGLGGVWRGVRHALVGACSTAICARYALDKFELLRQAPIHPSLRHCLCVSYTAAPAATTLKRPETRNRVWWCAQHSSACAYELLSTCAPHMR